MKKNLLSFMIIAVTSASLFGASTKKQVEQPMIEDPTLVNAAGAKLLLLNSLNSSYEQNKETCDKALHYADLKIKEDAGKLNSATSIVYTLATNGGIHSSDGMYDSSRFYTMCPARIIKYQIEKRGYTTEAEHDIYNSTNFKIYW